MNGTGIGDGMPVCRQGGLVARAAICGGGLWRAGAGKSFGFRPGPGKLDAVNRRQRLNIGHRRPEGGKIIRVAQPDQAWPRLSR